MVGGQRIRACWKESPNCALPVWRGIPGCITDGADEPKAYEKTQHTV